MYIKDCGRELPEDIGAWIKVLLKETTAQASGPCRT